MTNASIITKILGIKYPIISAPMANASGGWLAAEVTNAGGLGLIGAGYCDDEWVMKELSIVKEEEFGIGFITWRLKQNPKLLTLALRKKPKAIMLSFGDIAPFIEEIKSAAVPLICQIQNTAQAIDCMNKDADIIVAQGAEAGGHGATLGGMALIPSVADAVSLPVVAAGGICDARGIAAAFSLGACGVLMGTRFLASNESLASNTVKSQLIEAKGEDTIRTNVFDYARGLIWPEPYTARALKNEFTQRWHGISNLKEVISTDIQKAYYCATIENNISEAAVFAGEGVSLIKEILPAKIIIEQLIQNLIN